MSEKMVRVSVIFECLSPQIENEQVRRKTAKPFVDEDDGYVAAAARAAHREQQVYAVRGECFSVWEEGVGLGTTVWYMVRKFPGKGLEAPCREKPWRSPGSNLRHQIA